MIFDSHCHLTADAFDPDRDDVLSRAHAEGVHGIVTVASTPADAEAALALAERHRGVWCTAGIHPHEAERAGGDEALARVRELLDHERVVAVGECGLDFHYDNAPRDVQMRVFRAQIELAWQTGRPLVVHSRDADDDMVRVLADLPPDVRGVLHCFTGNDALLEVGLAAGWCISFSGIVTFKNFAGGDQVRAVPDERLLVETDAPYLAPVPHRGRRNEPAFVGETVQALARLRGSTPDELAALTDANARRFYALA
jgi:TatD DNase family protein